MTGIKNPGVVVVTGAGSGIGRATALRYAAGGATVACVDINEASAKETAQLCGSDALGWACDVTDTAAVIDLADAVAVALGDVDVLVNNAGVGVGGRFLDVPLEDWNWVRSVNLDGVVNGSYAFGRAMVERRRGQVVNIASLAAWVPNRRLAGYCTTKAGVLMFSRSLRADWRAHGVGVSTVCPGVTNTAIVESGRMAGVTTRLQNGVAATFRHSHDPDKIARAIIRASANDSAVVPAGFDAVLSYHAFRAVPLFVQDLAARL